MDSKTIDQDAYINLIVESTADIKSWEPILAELICKDCVIDAYAAVPFNENETELLLGTYDTKFYSIQICMTYADFNEYLNFFAKRMREGDIISVWTSFDELNDILDEKAGMD